MLVGASPIEAQEANHSLQCGATATATATEFAGAFGPPLVGTPDNVRDDDPATRIEFRSHSFVGAFQGEAVIALAWTVPTITRVEVLHELPGTGSGTWTIYLQTNGSWQSMLSGGGNFGVQTDSAVVAVSDVTAIKVEASGGAGNMTQSDYFLYELRAFGPGTELVCECSDTIDNDGDSQTDYPTDSGCTGPNDLSEEPDCSDGLDNDGDGFADFPADADCVDLDQPEETPAGSLGITFRKIADNNTIIPGDTQTFSTFGLPSLDDGAVAFTANSGVYKWEANLLSVVANTDTKVPGGAPLQEFCCFEDTSIDAGIVAFSGRASSPSHRGLYKQTVGGGLDVIADSNTQIPGTADIFWIAGFIKVSLDGGIAVFRQQNGNLPTPVEGIYMHNAGVLSVVADLNTPIPNGVGSFTSFSSRFADPDIEGGEVAFFGEGSGGQQGQYHAVSGSVGVVADLNTPPFQGFASSTDRPSTHSGDVAFGSTTPRGVYLSVGGIIHTVADVNTSPPGTLPNFQSFDPPSLDSGRVAFVGATTPTTGKFGLYVRWDDGSLEKIIDDADFLDGNDIDILSMKSEAFSGNEIAFWAFFTGGGAGIYVATISFECGDGIDNDGDGLTDYPADGGCSGGSDRTERRDCSDFYDNDGDGLTDYPNDPGCRNLSANSIEGPECHDGVDNDGDTLTDGNDPECAGSPTWWNNESVAKPPPGCGLGGGLALPLVPMMWLQARRSRRLTAP